MRTIYLFFSLLLSISAFGQPSPINRRAMALAGLAKGGFNVNDNLEFLWVGSDLNSTNNVSVWVDRVQGSIWGTNQSGTITADATSILFAGGQRMTNTGYVFPHNAGTYRTIVWIIKPTAGKSAVQQSLLGADDTGAQGFFWNQIAGALRWTDSGGNSTLALNVTANTAVQDWLITQTAVQAAPVPLDTYTNGVLSSSVSVGTTNPNKHALGASSGPNNFLWANIYEIRCYSNSVRGFIQSEVTVVHDYAVATYGVSP